MPGRATMPSPLYAAAAEMAGAAAAAIAADGGAPEEQRSQLREYMVDNSALLSPAPGLAYRRSCRQDDKDPGQLVEWGAVVNGLNLGNGWIRVGSQFLPFSVDGSPVLVPILEPSAADDIDVPEETGSLEETYRDPKPFEGSVVEISGMSGLAKNLLADTAEDEQVELDVDSQRGLCVGWIEVEQLYAVKTFEGLLVAVPEASLKVWTPPLAEDGGFDLPWVAGVPGDDGYYWSAIIEHLMTKGYCVIQTSLSAKEREDALDGAEEGRTFQRMKQELEAGYLGFDNNTKVAPLRSGEDAAAGAEDFGAQGGAETILRACDQQMFMLAMSLGSWTPASLGFSCHGVMNTMVRTSVDRTEEDDFYPESMWDDEPDEWTAAAEGYVRFVQRRKLLIMHMIDNSGGELWLYPKGDLESTSVRIPVLPNKLVIFRHDLMDYSYQVEGPSVALQTWVLDSPADSVQINALKVSPSSPGEPGLIITNPGPVQSTAPTGSIMSLANRMSGECWSPDHWWNAFVAGTDCDIKWPESRWETEPYYEPGDSVLTGKSYTCHGGFLSNLQITQFDNSFFGVNEQESRTMIPGQRLVCEVGYACLYKAGFRRGTLKGRRVGSWLGDVGPDWNSFQMDWGRYFSDEVVCPSTWATSMSCVCTAGRLSHVFDMKGPVSSYDTACSSSLIALNAAHSAMFRGQDAGSTQISRGLNSTGMCGEDCTEALVGGVNTLLGPGSFIGNCMANMLTHKGRCFTFTESADGYQRADACGMIFVRLFDGDPRDVEERVCRLTGTCSNADGRSASLTAPSGPAQQKLLRKSIGFSGIDPATVTFAECHGTGTSLGDPIEVGAMAAVLCLDRTTPVLVGSHKSNTGHSEAGAGISGLTKCIMFLGMQAAPPNCHFNVLNPNITVEGFPQYFASETVDTGLSESFCGVSSFGFGGSNARADIAGVALRGPRESLLVPLPRVNVPREIPMGQALFICGSWTGWSQFESLECSNGGVYTCFVRLGATRREEFHISCDPHGGGARTIHPLVRRAGQRSQIVGPDAEGYGLNFLIDGVKDQEPSGAVYRVDFTWSEDKKSISWAPVRAPLDAELAIVGQGYKHRYSLSGTWLRSGEVQDMVAEDDAYRAQFRIGVRSQEEFYIVADGSRHHLIYPEFPQTRESGQVLGPDADRGERSWLVRGQVHQVVEVTLRFTDGRIFVQAVPRTT